MSSQLPYPLPGQFKPEGPYRNPGRTVPMPSPQNMPAACWYGTTTARSWAAGAGGVTWTASWGTPIFDLRPDLRGTFQNERRNVRGAPPLVGGFRTPLGAIPMWRSGGKNVGIKLWVTIDGSGGTLDALDLRGFEILARERGASHDLNQMRTITDQADVTSEFANNGTAVVMIWMPHGEGYPLRYWELGLTFQIMANSGYVGATGPAICVTGAMY